MIEKMLSVDGKKAEALQKVSEWEDLTMRRRRPDTIAPRSSSSSSSGTLRNHDQRSIELRIKSNHL